MDFKQFQFHPKLLAAIEGLGFSTPTPIQESAIPKVLQGCDLRASAQTGTGKTAAFLLPSIHKLNSPKPGRGPRVLILVPTRELALQVANEASQFSKQLPHIKTVCIFGGSPYPPQNKALSRPHEILVATPGRLIDHLERGRVDLSRVELFILDEADRMLDMGFIQPVEQIASLTPATRQTLLFSATMGKNVLKLSERLLRNPEEIILAANHSIDGKIEQRLHQVDDIDHKYDLLNHLLQDETMNQTIVFTSTKKQADTLAERLEEKGHAAAALHGDLNQRQRTRTLDRLRHGEIRILVATDVASRGIDVETITHVINFDMPQSGEDYVHRIGRTGRAGASGTALSFASPRDRHLVREIEKFTGHSITPHVVAGLEPKRTPSPRRPFSNRKRSFRFRGRPAFKGK